ncbi:hypothetical protein V1525DRAFT_429000 [Lipomyces kononenkoae]|uniref:Uncharacterized protein n=1 Tax=Lipomyces kononenkoae TaxID=34357 RepID=A0ACC3TBC0_LIPKO
MGSYSADEDSRRIYLVSSALSPEEYRYYPHWFAELVPPGHLTLTLDDMLVFCDRFGITEQDKWKIFDIFESPLSTLEKGEFYAFMRLVGHVMNGKEPSRSLVFEQAPVPKIVQEAEVALHSDGTMSSSASQEPSLTLPASSGASPARDPSDVPVSPVLDGSRVNPFRRHQEQKSRPSQEISSSSEPSTPMVSAEMALPDARTISKDTPSLDVQAVDAFTKMLRGESSDATPRKSSDSSTPDRSNRAGSSEIKQDIPVSDATDIEESSSSLSSEADDDDDAVDEDSTSTAKNITPDDSISLLSPDKLDSRQPAVHSVQSQHYTVIPKEIELNAMPRKSLETDYSKRPAPPPPPPRKSGASFSHPIVATATATSDVRTVHLPSLGSSRSSSSSSLPKSISKPAPGISPTDNNRKFSASARSLSPSSTLHPSHQSDASHEVSGTAQSSVHSHVDFDAAFDEQKLFAAVGSPPIARVNGPQTAASSQKSHAPPPPPPSRRRVSHPTDQSIPPSPTTQGHRPPPHPIPPLPSAPGSSHSAGKNTTATATTSSSSKTVVVDDSAVPDLLADLTALQREVDALREHHLQDM